jgi:hypothetical protein
MQFVVRWPSGRRRSPAKGVYPLNGIEGSTPSLTAINSQQKSPSESLGFFVFIGCFIAPLSLHSRALIAPRYCPLPWFFDSAFRASSGSERRGACFDPGK